MSPQPHSPERPSATIPSEPRDLPVLSWTWPGGVVGAEPVVERTASLPDRLAWIARRDRRDPDDVVAIAAPGAMRDTAHLPDVVSLVRGLVLGPGALDGAAEHDDGLRGRTGTMAPRDVREWVGRRSAHESVSPIDTALVVSELVTNVERHAPGPFLVELCSDPRGLVVSVSDTAPERCPEPRSPGSADLSGRGLGIVETLSVWWGVLVQPGSKTVWALLPRLYTA